MIKIYGTLFSQAKDEDTLVEAYYSGIPAVSIEFLDDFLFLIKTGYSRNNISPLIEKVIDVRDYAVGTVHMIRVPVFQKQFLYEPSEEEVRQFYFGASEGNEYYTNYRPDAWFTRFSIVDAAKAVNVKLEYYARMFGAASNTVGFYRKPGTDECAIFPRVLTLYVNSNPVVLQNSSWMKDWMADFDANYVFDYAKMDARLAAIMNMDANESLAYLEAQLDFVTKMLLAVIESNPDLKLAVLQKVEQYANFKSAFDAHSLFTVKPETNCIEEIQEGKARVRSVQSSYFEAKGGTGDGGNSES